MKTWQENYRNRYGTQRLVIVVQGHTQSRAKEFSIAGLPMQILRGCNLDASLLGLCRPSFATIALTSFQSISVSFSLAKLNTGDRSESRFQR
jgi:hypothetical protein